MQVKGERAELRSIPGKKESEQRSLPVRLYLPLPASCLSSAEIIIERVA